MVDIGSEWDAADHSINPLFWNRMEFDQEIFHNITHDGRRLENIWYDTTDRTDIDPDAAINLNGGHLSDYTGAYLETVFYPSVADLRAYPSFSKMERTSIQFRNRAWTGKTCLIDGMFNARDRLPRIGIVRKLDGTQLPGVTVILEGVNNREIATADNRGVWGKYLAVDEYPGATVISLNGLVYDLTSQTEIQECIFEQKVKRRTKANVPTRQLHRKFD